MSKIITNFAPKLCASMKLLLILLSVMTWTVESKSNVTGEGTWPYDIEVSYSNTYQKGQVRKDDEAVLTLSNLGGITIEQIEVWLKSNKSSGSGRIEVSSNGEQLTVKEGSFKDWFGAYDNSAFHGLNLLKNEKSGVQEIVVDLLGVENSLTVEKYVITYSMGAAYTVKLMNGASEYGELTEAEGQAGVVLPSLSDWEEWKFVGWSEKEFWEMSKVDWYAAGTVYHPKKNCTLWAVYQYGEQTETGYVTELKTGTYIYLNTGENSRQAISGVPPQNGKWTPAPADPANENQHYLITFNAACDSATIQHVKTGKFIGYNGTKLVEKESKWAVYHGGDKTGFYITVSGKNYILWPDIVESSVTYAGLMVATNISSTPTALQVAKTGTDEATFTCHPESGKGLENLTEEEKSSLKVVMHMGAYDLIIYNGQKFLMVK